MSLAHADSGKVRRPLRLWPAVLVAAVIALLRFVAPIVQPEAAGYGVFAAIGGSALILLWWLLFSRAPWVERLGALVLMALATMATRPLLHASITGGMMGLMFFVYAIPSTLSLAFVAWAVLSRHRTGAFRWATMAIAIAIGVGVWTLIRTDGVTGHGTAQLHWRWTPTPEERLLAQGNDAPALPAPAEPVAATTPPTAPPVPTETATARDTNRPPAAVSSPAAGLKSGIPGAGAALGSTASAEAATPAEWPGFRGPDRDGAVHGVRIETDWASSPPKQIWRRPIGPGWSSFAVAGDRFYTQEQRGDDEIVACYRLSTGRLVWTHKDRVRFWESNGGAGPRATPTVSHGRVYTFGATGILNVLDAATGALVWSRDVATEADKQVPTWGFSSSPLVVDDLVVIAAAGKLAAYDRATGLPRWFGPNGGGYSSPHLMTIHGVPQVVFLSSTGAMGFRPSDGTMLWEHAWPGTPIVQPAAAGEDVLIASGDMMGGMGIRRITVTNGSGGWKAQERWASRGLKPYYNDIAVHEGHAYGFDGSILSCIDTETGTRKWKGGRYGQGQLVLLPDQDLLLVLSEEGDLALVSATPDAHTEIAKFKAIEGKTWNHPVLVGDVLLVRNGEEMAAFRLSLVGR